MSKSLNHDQESFLNHISKRLGRERRSNVSPPKYDQFPWDHLYQGMDQEGLIQQFIKNLEAIAGKVRRISLADVANEIINIIDEIQAKKVIIWDDPRLEQYGIEEALKDKIEYMKWETTKGFETLTQYAEKSQMGITVTELGLSETGTIVLYNEGGKGRSVSLLPEVHVAILPSEKIVTRLTQALQMIKRTFDEKGRLPSLINFISGPSRTSDIEMVLTTGVHGPKELYVLIVD
ncbi:LutC/YkgG family protein [Tepidibacillus fermentans]|uniref:L-lactate dehydrogenase complex protein LldG n=1 Tax=Tepidibacillus fermentans TaxID=1281767 RepID=A0A4R3KI11_9BACI|nr:lactate utilization protein C [Tepidibacillus fermentans]TCS83143.1 L-lactate dehydrogenase complex protein LldG [Tepidibacillus fermentans]